jgi:hypothetical protein
MCQDKTFQFPHILPAIPLPISTLTLTVKSRHSRITASPTFHQLVFPRRLVKTLAIFRAVNISPIFGLLVFPEKFSLSLAAKSRPGHEILPSRKCRTLGLAAYSFRRRNQKEKMMDTGLSSQQRPWPARGVIRTFGFLGYDALQSLTTPRVLSNHPLELSE